MAKILIIDDEEIVRFTLREILESDGHDVSEASDGNKGLNAQRADPAELVITDIIMPEKEGVETIIELQKEFPDTKIIAISGGGRMKNMDFLEVAKKFGAHSVMSKPFSAKELIAQVRACIAE